MSASRSRRAARRALLAGALLIVLGAQRALADDAAPFAGVVLEDPDGRQWDLSALVGQPALVVVADRGASGKAVDWGRAIGAARPQGIAPWVSPGKVATISIADLRVVPGFARGSARWIISVLVSAQAGQGGPPLLLDWDGAVAGRIGAQDGVPNVRLYAPDGSLVVRDAGDPTPDKIARLAAAIDGLVGAGGTPSPTPGAAASAAPEQP
jgi:hypothetical protein